MKNANELQKDWEKAKEQIVRLSKDALDLAKKGEAELVTLSKKTRIHFDLTALSLHKEKLIYQIGKEFIKSKVEVSSVTLKKLLQEFHKLENDEKKLRNKIKAAGKASGYT